MQPKVVSAALRGESLLGIQTRAPASHRAEKADSKLLHLQASIHERDAFHRDQMLKTEKKFKKTLTAKGKKITELEKQVEALLGGWPDRSC
jgi:hypothetical protein